MPLIEYSCPDGHGRFELLLGHTVLSEKPELRESAQCPECGKPSPRFWAEQGHTVIYKGDWFKTKGKY